MPRIVQISLPSEQTHSLLAEIREIDGVFSLRCERGTSITPPGDVITLTLTNQAHETLMERLDRHGIGCDASSAVLTTEPAALISEPHKHAIASDSSESTWEEMDAMLGKESNMSVNSLLVMSIAGMLSVAGLASNSLHTVIGASLIAPGFEPLSRIALGIVTGGEGWKRGMVDTGKGYAALVVGAILATLFGGVMNKDPVAGELSYYGAGGLLGYWTSGSAWSIFASVVASAAGALLIVSNRSILTAGVMISLALVPTLAAAGMAAVAGEWNMAGQAFVRWALEVVIVTAVSAMVFVGHRLLRERRATDA